jgi:hypothetical protein
MKKREKEHQGSRKKGQNSRKAQRNRENQQTVPSLSWAPWEGERKLKTPSQGKPDDDSNCKTILHLPKILKPSAGT